MYVNPKTTLISDKICKFHVNEPIVLKQFDPNFAKVNTLCFGYSSIRIHRRKRKKIKTIDFSFMNRFAQ